MTPQSQPSIILIVLTRVLSKEALSTAKVLPYEGWVSLKVIHKDFIKRLRPVNSVHYC